MNESFVSGYIAIEQAIDAVGRRLMPHQWLGQEVLLLKSDSRALEETEAASAEATVTETPLGRLNRAVNYLIHALFAGEVKAVTAGEDGHIRDLPAALWMRPGIRAVFGSGKLPINFCVALEGHRADTGKRWVLVSELDLHRSLAALAAAPATADVEAEFGSWLARKIAEHAEGTPLRKRQTWMEAQGVFGARLPFRSFERIWTATVPQTWQRAVRANRAKPAE
jgi:hypothetical protein